MFFKNHTHFTWPRPLFEHSHHDLIAATKIDASLSDHTMKNILLHLLEGGVIIALNESTRREGVTGRVGYWLL